MQPAKICFILPLLGILFFLFLPHPAQAQGLFIRGDINGDAVVDTADLRLLTATTDNFCNDRRDVNDDGDYGEFSRLYDSTYLANYLFFDGPPPPHPFPSCGFDTTFDYFACPISSCCTLATECDDGLDNDGDGLVDFNDCGCSSGACDSTEGPNPVTHCSDAIDNDGDGLVDLADTNCANICDNTEASIICIHKPCDADIYGREDGRWNLSDIINFVGMVFKGAAKPSPLCRADCNASGGNPTISDIVYLVNKVFKGGPDPLPIGECCKD